MWCLGRLLPLMIGKKISEECAHWENYLLLLTIIDYCFAPTISEEWVAYLRMMIDEHHKCFTQLYPSCRLIPKAHYLVHYPEIMCKYGPLTRYWCMRFEGKHNYFKDLAHRIKSFKNVPKTMATRHQLLMCYYRSSSVDSSIFYKDTNSGPGKIIVITMINY
jgi:hypothetical protein